MPYHVQLFWRLNHGPETILDVDPDTLETRLLEPYRDGKDFTIRGIIVRISELKRVKITYSEVSSDILLSVIDSRSQGIDIVPLDKASRARQAADSARDVTDELVSGSRSRQDNQNKRNVFLVRGRWNKAVDAMVAFLRSLDLKPIQWDDAVRALPQASRTTPEILEKGFDMCYAALVFMTPDDVAALHPELLKEGEEVEPLTGQARPNVLFEAGMAWQRGRGRTLLVEYGKLRRISNLSGIDRVKFDGDIRSRKELAGRLKSLGVAVDDSGDEWLTAGGFPGHLPHISGEVFTQPKSQ